MPDLPLVTRAMGWVTGAFARTGHDPALGCRLGSVLAAAGLPGPVCLGMQSYLPPEVPAGAHLLAETVRTLLPMIEATRVATADEVDVDTLERRILADLRAEGAYAKPPTLVGAWAHTAG